MSFSPTVIMTVADLSVMECEVMVDETDFRNLKLGQEAKIKVDALEGVEMKGEVTEIGASALVRGSGSQSAAQTTLGANTGNQPKDFKVTITIKDPPANLRPGLNATADITTAKREKVLAVPVQAVVVREVNKEGKVVDPDSGQGGGPESLEQRRNLPAPPGILFGNQRVEQHRRGGRVSQGDERAYSDLLIGAEGAEERNQRLQNRSGSDRHQCALDLGERAGQPFCSGARLQQVPQDPKSAVPVPCGQRRAAEATDALERLAVPLDARCQPELFELDQQGLVSRSHRRQIRHKVRQFCEGPLPAIAGRLPGRNLPQLFLVPRRHEFPRFPGEQLLHLFPGVVGERLVGVAGPANLLP